MLPWRSQENARLTGSPASIPAAPSAGRIRFGPRARALAALGSVLLFTHLPSLLSRSTIQDEAVYVVVARELLHGGRLYLDVVDRKPPALFWVYEGILRLFGTHNWLALHLVGMLWVLATMAALYVVGARIAGPAAGVIAAVLYPIFQGFWEVTNLALNGEVLMNLPVVAGFAIAFRQSRSRWRPELLLAGAMPALGFLLKQPAGIAGLPLGIYVLLPAYRRARSLAWRHSLVHAIWLCVGFAGALALAALALHARGELAEAVHWSVLDHDVPYGPLSAVFWERGIRMTLIFGVCSAPLLLATHWSLGARVHWEGREPERLALMIFLGASALGTAASGRFFDYYYIQLLPSLCLLAAHWIARAWRERPRPARVRGIGAAVALSAIVFFVVNLAERPYPLGTAAAGRYIRAHAGPDDRLFVWGQYIRFYLHADLRPASRHIAFFPLTGYIFGSPWNHDPAHEDTRSRISPSAWSELKRDFALHPPRYILDTEGVRHPPKYPMADFPYLRDLITRDFRLALTAPEGLLYERRDTAPDTAGIAAPR